jgi:hypothetical protein
MNDPTIYNNDDSEQPLEYQQSEEFREMKTIKRIGTGEIDLEMNEFSERS